MTNLSKRLTSIVAMLSVFGAKKAGTPLFFSRPKGAGSEVFGKVKAKRF